MSTVFSETPARMSLRDLSRVLEAAVVSLAFIVPADSSKHTILGHHGDHCVLIHELHRLHTTLIDCSHGVDAPHPTLAISRGIQQGCLEVGIQLRVELSIVAEDHSDSLVSVDGSNLEVRSEGMLDKVAMIARHLQSVRTTDLHQGLIARLSRDRMRQFLRELADIARCVEVRVEKGLTAGYLRDVACQR